MDARAARPAPVRVRISDTGELAAAVPHLLGFRPAESIVLLGFVGEGGGRLGLTVRADLPPPEHRRAAARDLARRVVTDRPDGVVAVVVSEAPDDTDGLPHHELLREVRAALDGAAVPVREAVLVRRGRWWSYDCRLPCCAPGVGTPLPEEVTELAAAAVVAGIVVEPDRQALVRRIARTTGREAAAMAAVSDRVGAWLADEPGTAGRSWAYILSAVSGCRPGSGSLRLADRDVARVVWGLIDIGVRDRALGLALGEDAAAAEVLWTECTRRAPAPLDAAPATLLAVSAWLRGDGAMAGVALDRALESRPTYTLARLLADGLFACLRPDDLRAMIRTSVAGLGAVP